MSRQFLILLSFGLACLVAGCSSSATKMLKPRVDHVQIHELAKPGVPIETVIDRFGEPHQRTPNNQSGETLLYKTFIDWDKFIDHRLFWIETNQRGRIVKTTTEIDDD